MPAEDTAAESGPAPWTSGPSSLEELLDQFLVENKFPGKLPGTTLYLTPAADRSGKVEECVPGQKWKLFMDPRLFLHFPSGVEANKNLFCDKSLGGFWGANMFFR